MQKTHDNEIDIKCTVLEMLHSVLYYCCALHANEAANPTLDHPTA